MGAIFLCFPFHLNVQRPYEQTVTTYANSGAYDEVADILFKEENVHAYYLEFDDERSGGFSPLERLYLSPQCGFASCEIGNKLTEEEQWNKLSLVKEIACEVLEN